MNRATLRPLAVLICFTSLAAATLAVADEVQIESDVQYGTGAGEKLTLHLARPTAGDGPFPVIVAIHGGAWQGGKKEGHLPQIKQYAQQGYVAVTVGYRLAPKHHFPAKSKIASARCAGSALMPKS